MCDKSQIVFSYIKTVMIDQFAIFHKKEPGNKGLAMPAGHFHLATCLRSIIFAWTQDSPFDDASYQVYRGAEAYEFILKIICGLESPLLGETEIFGQFKDFFKANQDHFSSDMLEVFNNLIRDTKKIRSQFLQNLGCTSYGSLLRKKLRHKDYDLVVLGAGSLAQDIFPWFAKKASRVRAYTRNPKKHQQLADQQTNLSVEEFGSITTGQADESVLVIASPLTAHQISQMCDLSEFVKIYDLRADSHQDALPATRVVTLKALFADLEVHRKQAIEVKENAVVAIRKKATIFSRLEKQRPFGWEDLWTYA